MRAPELASFTRVLYECMCAECVAGRACDLYDSFAETGRQHVYTVIHLISPLRNYFRYPARGDVVYGINSLVKYSDLRAVIEYVLSFFVWFFVLGDFKVAAALFLLVVIIRVI